MKCSSLVLKDSPTSPLLSSFVVPEESGYHFLHVVQMVSFGSEIKQGAVYMFNLAEVLRGRAGMRLGAPSWSASSLLADRQALWAVLQEAEELEAVAASKLGETMDLPLEEKIRWEKRIIRFLPRPSVCVCVPPCIHARMCASLVAQGPLSAAEQCFCYFLQHFFLLLSLQIFHGSR